MSNFASSALGAEVVEVSTDPSFTSSSYYNSASAPPSDPRNLLLDRNDALWLAGDAPQYVTIQIKKGHPPIRFVGWHVWRDYVTNPKTVIVTSGRSLAVDSSSFAESGSTSKQKGSLLEHFVHECVAVEGAGTQLWELTSPISSDHTLIQFRITSTFAPGPTYMNRLVLFSTNPNEGGGGQEGVNSSHGNGDHTQKRRGRNDGQNGHRSDSHDEGTSRSGSEDSSSKDDEGTFRDDESNANTVTSAIAAAANNYSTATSYGGGNLYGAANDSSTSINVASRNNNPPLPSSHRPGVGGHTPLNVDTTARHFHRPLNSSATVMTHHNHQQSPHAANINNNNNSTSNTSTNLNNTGGNLQHYGSAGSSSPFSATINHHYNSQTSAATTTDRSRTDRSKRDEGVGNANNTNYASRASGRGQEFSGATEGKRAGSIQMSDLLAGLDDDIKRLHPIKTISPTKRPANHGGRSISPSVMLPEVEEDLNALHNQLSSQQQQQQHMMMMGMGSMGSMSQASQHHTPSMSNFQVAPLPLPPMPLPHPSHQPSPTPHVQYVQIPPPPPDPSGQEALMRVRALERAVEMLTKAVERQGEDISEMRRMLVDQNTLHQRREEERAREMKAQLDLITIEARSAAKAEVEALSITNSTIYQQRLQHSQSAAAAGINNSAVHNQGPQSASSTVGGEVAVKIGTSAAVTNSSNVANQQPPLQLIEFPETALKNYIEDVLAPRLSKHAKRAEARTVQQIDDHMHVLLKEIGAVVDERVERHLHKIMRDGARHPYSKAVHSVLGASTSSLSTAMGGGTHDEAKKRSKGRKDEEEGRGGAHHSAHSYYGTYEEIYGHGGSRQKPLPSKQHSYL